MGEEEKGIELCKELASMYENEMFDYEKLSWTLVRIRECREWGRRRKVLSCVKSLPTCTKMRCLTMRNSAELW